VNFASLKSMKSTTILGLMSGTSLDGLDMAVCRFTPGPVPQYEIIAAETVPYSFQWRSRIIQSAEGTAADLARLHHDIGCYFGVHVKEWLKKINVSPDAIASHGHTIYHQPEKGLTLQVGEGSAIAAITGITTISDFRTLDVNLGGQGAPLVPVGDATLFSEYTACLNLGGFANISFDENGKRIAFDISPVNMALNYVAGFNGEEYDDRGKLARSGSLMKDLYDDLNSIRYYSQQSPKSLGREWYEENFHPRLLRSAKAENLLHTLCKHIAYQVGQATKMKTDGKMLVTGGGAFNDFLIECIRGETKLEIVVPGEDLICFKEALVFAWLGYLRLNSQVNTLSSVTGASRDSCGGAIYQPF
jgi:anhydro-N-acetylmuramic acid kinase